MTPSERARRYDQLYREGSTRQSLVDMIVARESDISDLLDKLGALRELCSALAARVRLLELETDMNVMDARLLETMDRLEVEHGKPD